MHEESVSPPGGNKRDIDEAVRRATAGAVRRHFMLGQAIAVWRNGRVIWIEPTDPEALEFIHGKQPSRS